MTVRGTRRTVVACTAAALLALTGCSSDGNNRVDAGPTTSARGPGGNSTTTAAAHAGADGGPLARYADYRSKNYHDPTHWVCRPDATDACDENLDATVVKADGTTAVERFVPADHPAIDCFYVYPTISADKTPFSDWNASPQQEGYVTKQQAARLGSTCRVFAPVYRQVTLTSLGAGLAGRRASGAPKGDPFGDVLDAFRTYMADDNDGRGVVLIGHSQGTAMLSQLIRTEIDPNADVRAKLVGAYLAGGAVAVPEGKVVGGDFRHVPLCTSGTQAGCVTTWASFRSTAPPPADSLFGRPRQGTGVAGCVNPAGVGGGDVDLHAYFPTGARGARWLAGPAGTAIDTPFVSVPGLVSGRCTSKDGFHYLAVTVHADPADPRVDDIGGDLTPQWGLHLADVSLVMGDIVDRVERQAETYAG